MPEAVDPLPPLDAVSLWDVDDDPVRCPLSIAELDELYRLLDAEEAADAATDQPAAGQPAADGAESTWALPGVETVDRSGDRAGLSVGSLSVGSVAVLGELAAAWETLRRAQARCYRALTALEASDAAAESGYRFTSRLLAEHVRIDPGEARRLARQARALSVTVPPSGTDIPASLPATAEQVSAGQVGPGHVEVIRATLTRLGAVVPVIDAETLAETERQLAQLALTHTPSALAEAARAIEALLDPDGAAPRDEPLPDNELHYLRRRDGSLVGKFTYRDPAAAESLHTALTVATPPPEQVPDPEPDGPRGESAGVQAARTLPERRAQALLTLAGEALTRGLDVVGDEQDGGHGEGEGTTAWGLFPEHDPVPGPWSAPPAVAHDATAGDGGSGPDASEVDPGAAGPPDPPAAPDGAGEGPSGRTVEPPGWTRADLEGGERVALTVTLDLDTLRSAVARTTIGPAAGSPARPALLGENTWVRAETARRLACDAEVIPAVLGTRGEVLDLGRRMRTVSTALRRALVLRDRHCAHPGCRRRARRCQAHHITHWVQGGESCLENTVLLCGYHHTLTHHGGWQIHMIDGLPWFTPPRWIDPHQQPRHNRPWHTLTAAG